MRKDGHDLRTEGWTKRVTMRVSILFRVRVPVGSGVEFRDFRLLDLTLRSSGGFSVLGRT